MGASFIFDDKLTELVGFKVPADVWAFLAERGKDQGLSPGQVARKFVLDAWSRETAAERAGSVCAALTSSGASDAK